MSKRLVVVESPTKARTIRKFLGPDYIVESCMGHIRDLPQSAKDIPEMYKGHSWSNLGVNIESHFEPIYCIPKTKQKVVRELKSKLKGITELILATDEDREGESISWHLVEVLKPKVPIRRMVFHEITKEAILSSLKNFREIDSNLVKAQETRRVLDRLVGYTISPLLWKKVAYGLSAGRVQSVAVKLIVEKETARINFNKSDYWGIQGICSKGQKEFESRFTAYDQKSFALGKDFDSKTGALKENLKNCEVLEESKAKSIVAEVEGKTWEVMKVEEKTIRRQPQAPFITSTLQQEAFTKLGWTARDTMGVAQKLYEQGFITYMRTDSVQLSAQALEGAKSRIQSLYGKKYLLSAPRDFSKKKVKGAQEAHEAIRPSGTEYKTSDELGLKKQQAELYDLIWRRTLASQMQEAKIRQLSVELKCGKTKAQASGSVIEFDGFLKLFPKSLETKVLPDLKVGEKVQMGSIESKSHETKPPARFTEASLVQMLEKEGVGRPSTYAVIISNIQHRGYVKKSGNALAPTFTAMIVAKLLSKYFPQYVDTEFTSQMENSLDEIAQGQMDWEAYLRTVYLGEGVLRLLWNKESRILTAQRLEVWKSKNLKGWFSKWDVMEPMFVKKAPMERKFVQACLRTNF